MGKNTLRILAVTNGWPTSRFPEYCVFNKRQVEDVRALGIHIDVKFINAREDGKKSYFSALPELARQANGYDLVHCFHGLSFLLARSARVQKPLVVSFLNALENEYIDLPSPLRGLVTSLTKRMVFSSDSPYGTIFKDRVPPELTTHPLARNIPNGIDARLFKPGDKALARQALGLDPKAVYLLFVSSKDLYRSQKRYDRFQKLLMAYRAAYPEKQIHELTLVSEPEDVVLHTYQAADAHVMTSDFEGSPNSVKEALACGLPIVSTDVGNVAEMTAGLEAARVAPEFSVKGFSVLLDQVLSTDSQARMALRNAITTQGLDSPTAAQKVVDLYKMVVEASPDTSNLPARSEDHITTPQGL